MDYMCLTNDSLEKGVVTLATLHARAQVLGCAKGVVATVLSVLIFRNPVTLVGAAGYGLTVAGVFAYGWTKKKK